MLLASFVALLLLSAWSVEPSWSDAQRLVLVNGDRRHKIGFVIEHNPANEPDAGSCIRACLEVRRCAGCTAMAEPAMRGLLSWLRPDAEPVFVLLPMRSTSACVMRGGYQELPQPPSNDACAKRARRLRRPRLASLQVNTQKSPDYL